MKNKYIKLELEKILLLLFTVSILFNLFMMLFEYGLSLMSKQSTQSFYFGICIVIGSIITFVYVVSLYIKFFLKENNVDKNNNDINPNPNPTPVNESESSAERLEALRILNNRFMSVGITAHLSDTQIKLVLDAMQEYKK
jgi:ABC-type transport system involved in multi-copper enzyme maturation permease subunit